jgi:hypothetical protein
MATETGDVSGETDDNPDSDIEAGGASGDTGTGEEGLSDHARSAVVTGTATILGIVAGIASTLFATNAGQPDNTLGLGLLIGAVIVQFPFYQAIGIDVTEFETKDQLYIFFMSFALWFITWGLLLTTGGLQ